MSAVPDRDLHERRSFGGELIEVVRRPPLAAALGLQPHPEGGWYRRTWTSPVTAPAPGGRGARPTATVILFALPAGEVSAWHRVTSPEVWVWNGLGPVRLELGGSGPVPVTAPDAAPDSCGTRLLDAPARGGEVQVVVPGDVWQRTLPSDVDALVTCLVSPGFDPADFTLAGG